MKTLKIVVNLALVGLLVWFLATHEQKIRASVAGRDSIQYWATGTLLVHRQNPYSVPSVLALERSQGYPADRPLMLRTPPWSMGMVLLLGIALFLLLEEDRPFLAGAALLIPLAKPHIFTLLWPILAVWVVTRKRWSLLGGFATAFLLALSIAVAFDPSIFQHYREMLQEQAIQHEFIPALSGMIRGIFFRRYFWVQF